MSIILLIIGLVLILGGASFLTDGSSSLAKRFGVSEFMVGVTIVGIGTSAPELVVTILSSAQGNSDIAVGNILGSNIFNSLMILGVTALIAPVVFSSGQLKKEIPFMFLSSMVLLIVGSDMLLGDGSRNTISRSEGILLLCLFIVFIIYSIYNASASQSSQQENPTEKPQKIGVMLLKILAGLAALIWGGDLFVQGAVEVATMLGISQAMIAITLMAGGTSLPELASCAVAAYKKKGDLALGNVIGSNISNVFLILGCGATLSPLTLNNISLIDLLVLVGASLLVFVTSFTFKTRKIDRIEGVIFIMLYVGYIYYLSCAN